MSNPPRQRPNVVFVFADQWRAQATGYAGDPNAITPNLDKLAEESLNFTNAVSGCPVCTPYRGSLLTGQYWLTHGAFMNDVCLRDEAISIAEAYKEAGYDTAYIGKWHL
ncbi:MAG: sulfatase-like hydrolase/transferase, partial [bacterium]|nr:sulfatase-like hydrolase/transferase [bacterium]